MYDSSETQGAGNQLGQEKGRYESFQEIFRRADPTVCPWVSEDVPAYDVIRSDATFY